MLNITNFATAAEGVANTTMVRLRGLTLLWEPQPCAARVRHPVNLLLCSG